MVETLRAKTKEVYSTVTEVMMGLSIRETQVCDLMLLVKIHRVWSKQATKIF